jgi:hypothetical protein
MVKKARGKPLNKGFDRQLWEVRNNEDHKSGDHGQGRE